MENRPPAETHVIVSATPGAPRVLMTGTRPQRLYSREDFEENLRYGAIEASNPGEVVALQRWPEFADQARFGLLRIDRQVVTVVVDGNDKGPSLLVDLDADGDVADEETWSRVEPLEMVAFEGILPGGVPIRLALSDDLPGWILVFDSAVREGVIHVEGRRVAFALVGRQGVYDAPDALVG